MATVRIAQIAGGQFEKGSDEARAAEETLDEWSAAAAGEAVPESRKKRGTDDRRRTRALLGDIGVKIVKKKETTDGD